MAIQRLNTLFLSLVIIIILRKKRVRVSDGSLYNVEIRDAYNLHSPCYVCFLAWVPYKTEVTEKKFGGAHVVSTGLCSVLHILYHSSIHQVDHISLPN